MYENVRLGSPITNPEPMKFGIKLKPQEYHDWIKFSKKTQFRDFDGRTFEEQVIWKMSQSDYLYEMNDNQRYAAIQKINRNALEYGFEVLLMMPAYSDLSQAIDMNKELIEQGLKPSQGVNIIE